LNEVLGAHFTFIPCICRWTSFVEDVMEREMCAF
jgi:hypothetical protein